MLVNAAASDGPADVEVSRRDRMQSASTGASQTGVHDAFSTGALQDDEYFPTFDEYFPRVGMQQDAPSLIPSTPGASGWREYSRRPRLQC